jgi:dGTPase
VIDTTADNLRRVAPTDSDAVRRHDRPLVLMSAGIARDHQELKQYLGEHLYRHHRVLRMTSKAQRVVHELFDAFMSDTRLMPPEYHQAAQRMAASRVVADYIAGMTDRYAILEHRRLFEPGERT